MSLVEVESAEAMIVVEDAYSASGLFVLRSKLIGKRVTRSMY
jgi:hypothetical protein